MARPTAEKIKSFHSPNQTIPTFSLPQITQVRTEARLRIITNTTVIMSPHELSLSFCIYYSQSFLPFCYKTKQEFLFHLHHSDIQYHISEELSLFTLMLMNILACLGIHESHLFGKQERKIIKKTQISIYTCVFYKMLLQFKNVHIFLE